MKKILLLSIYLFAFNFMNAQKVDVKVMRFNQFESYLNQDNDTLYIVNFWATWCKPCVAELPYFEKINSEYANNKVKVILVSVDFKDDLESRLIPFLKNKNIKSEVILLDETDPNTYIDKVSKKWSGAIPVTYIYRGDNVNFYEKNFTYKDLNLLVMQFLIQD